MEEKTADKTAMQNIINANKGLELLEKRLREMGGGISSVKKVSTDFNQTFATITICFYSDRLEEYISQLQDKEEE
jgi:hypothetical protein